jgi:hypothetical protein
MDDREEGAGLSVFHRSCLSVASVITDGQKPAKHEELLVPELHLEECGSGSHLISAEPQSSQSHDGCVVPAPIPGGKGMLCTPGGGDSVGIENLVYPGEDSLLERSLLVPSILHVVLCCEVFLWFI